MESVRQDARPRAPALVKTTNFSGPPAGFPLFFPAGISLPPMDAGGTFLPPAFPAAQALPVPAHILSGTTVLPAGQISTRGCLPWNMDIPPLPVSPSSGWGIPPAGGSVLPPAFLCLFPRGFPVSSRRPSLPMAGSRSKIKRMRDVISFSPFSLPGGRLCLIPKWFLPLPVRLTGLCFPPCAGVREPPAFFRPL